MTILPSEKSLQLNGNTVSVSDWVAACRAYVGLNYSFRRTRVRRDAHGILSGQTDCIRLFFLAARDCGLMNPTDELLESARVPRLPLLGEAQSRAVWCAQWLDLNCQPVSRSGFIVGDLLAMGEENDLAAGHLALLSHFTPLQILHATQWGENKVIESPLDAFWSTRIHDAYRLPNVIL